MILQALYNYYITMQAQQGSKIAPPGMEYKSIPFVIVIKEDGTFVRIEDTRNKQNKNKGESYLVPQGLGRSGPKSYETAYLFWDHKGYVLCCAKDDSDKATSDAKNQNQSFIKSINEICEASPSNQEFKAVAAFYSESKKEDNLDKVREDDLYSDIQKTPGANMSFKIQNSNRLVACHPDLKSLGSTTEDNPTQDLDQGVCLITGKKSKLKRLHQSIGTLVGAQATAALVSFQKNRGYDSYGKEQGLNAPISEEASFAMTTALTELLRSGQETNYKIGDMRLVFWNAHVRKDLIEAYKTATFGSPEEKEKGKNKRITEDDINTTEDTSYKVYDALKAFIGSKDGYIDTVSEDRFYVLGLTPNSGRIAVKLWQEGSVREIVGNTIQHLQDMNIVSQDGILDEEHPPLRNLFSIVKSVSIGTQDKWKSNLIEAITQSIVCGQQYPRTLQLACLNRIFQERTVTNLRAAILKAYLIRTHKYQITMALDPKNNNKAYLCGRLFAILERIQKSAIGETNSSIRDKYFTTAGNTPAVVFGKLISLSSHHLSKIRKERAGSAVSLEKELGAVFDLFPGQSPEFPTHFNLKEQSLFAVGYYHQRVDNYKRKKDTIENESATEIN